jgi:hypothetical protein
LQDKGYIKEETKRSFANRQKKILNLKLHPKPVQLEGSRMKNLRDQLSIQREYYLKILLSQSDEPDERRRLMKKKQGIFKNIIKDIAHKYQNINKKLLISLK